MKKIISLKQAARISQEVKEQGKTVVLVGGCFDLLHLGHIRFLQKAHQVGDYLFVALESNLNVKRRKGNGRPINLQKDRAEILAALEVVNFVVLLPDLQGFEDYLNLVKTIRPDVIAVTQNDYHLKQKKQQAQEIGAQILVVSPLLRIKSTTKLAQILEKET